MRKILTLMLIISMVAFVFTGCSSAKPTSESGGKNIKLNFATFWPSEDFQVADGHKAWVEEIKNRVEAETPHTIDIVLHPGGSLLGATEIYAGVSDGIADIGTTAPSYTPGVFPATSAFELPGLKNDNALVASLAIQEAFDTYEAIQKEYKDVKVMHFWATGPGDIISNKPINTLEDVKGMEIRVAGGSVPVIQALGGTPVSMSMSEAYLALDSGIVKGILGPTDILKGFKIAEVTKNVVKAPSLYNIVFVKVMNQKTWDSLPADVQKIFDEVNAEFVKKYGTLRAEHAIVGLQYAIEKHGMNVIELSPEEEKKWLDAISNVQDKWATDVSKNGVNGQDVLKKVRELDEKYSAQYGNEFK
ncbi:hypothetical protein BHU72_01465 [Desulfuribacillus stibiiarsenatis]|uniref:ABC transporter substrate-binding protein n=1 Tax=Desulfuribacillus stibiiarsenatis TaxID=1390249 RepID=A0A1E5LAD1_9FIRM|nr:TRAP transporter substrate-binding protein [Desulfuribacillus stibiiarsenatis]OEH86953.1 hypothetical protein BHU72_01465 [Desulfuribacillus stibiiarsenatis]